MWRHRNGRRLIQHDFPTFDLFARKIASAPTNDKEKFDFVFWLTFFFSTLSEIQLALSVTSPFDIPIDITDPLPAIPSDLHRQPFILFLSHTSPPPSSARTTFHQKGRSRSRPPRFSVSRLGFASIFLILSGISFILPRLKAVTCSLAFSFLRCVSTTILDF